MNVLKNVIRNIKRSRALVYKNIFCSVECREDLFGSVMEEYNPEILYEGLISAEDFHLIKIILLDKYSMKEAAQEQGISVEACKKRVTREQK